MESERENRAVSVHCQLQPREQGLLSKRVQTLNTGTEHARSLSLSHSLSLYISLIIIIIIMPVSTPITQMSDLCQFLEAVRGRMNMVSGHAASIAVGDSRSEMTTRTISRVSSGLCARCLTTQWTSMMTQYWWVRVRIGEPY